MNERIKKLRKALDLTQQEFGDRIGIKRNTLANYEIGRNEPIDAVVSLICREFNISEKWLRTGEGEMFVPKEADALNELVKQYDLSDGDYILIEKFLKLRPAERQAVITYMQDVVVALNSGMEVAPETETTTSIPDPDGQERTPTETTGSERVETEKAEEKKTPILWGEDGLEAQKKQLMAFLDKMAPDQLQMYYDQMRRLKQPPTETLSPSVLTGADKKVPESDPSNLA